MRDIAITGMGVVSAIGVSPESYWTNLVNGTLGMQAIPEERVAGPHWWSPVADAFDLGTFIDDPRLARRTEAFTQYALAAAVQAVRSVGTALPPERTAVVIGTSMGSVPGLTKAQARFDREGAEAVPARLMAMVIPNMASAHIAMHLGLHGPQLTVTTACASSLDAIGLAAMLLDGGGADVATRAAPRTSSICSSSRVCATPGRFRPRRRASSRRAPSTARAPGS